VGATDGKAGRQELIVSIHDVAASTEKESRWLLAALDGISIRPRSLLIVPGEPDPSIERAPELLAILREEAGAGSEQVLHGYCHRRAGPFRGPWPNRLRGELFARDQAEFLALDAPSARARVGLGLAAFKRAGLRTRGFCAPGWLPGPGLSGVLAELGFRYVVGFATVSDLAGRRSVFAPSGGYMGVPRDEGLIRLETALARAVAGRGALQLFLHPHGASHSRDCARVLRLVEKQARSRRLTTYEGLLDGRA
jgi:predicted deacetylase